MNRWPDLLQLSALGVFRGDEAASVVYALEAHKELRSVVEVKQAQTVRNPFARALG